MTTIMTSPDGIAWTAQSNPTWDSRPLDRWVMGWSIATSSDALVAVGLQPLSTDPVSIVRSTDAITWSPIVTPLDTDGGGYCMRYLPSVGLWVATSGNPNELSPHYKVLQSDDDGVTWVNTLSYPGSPPGNYAFWQVLGYAGDVPLLIENGGAYYGSGSPITWAAFPFDEPLFFSVNQFCCASDGAGHFTFAFNGGFGLEGTQTWDGTNWHSADMTVQSVVQAMAYGDGTWMWLQGVNEDATSGLVLTTPDPITTGWTNVGSFPALDPPYGFQPSDLVYGNAGTWVAVGSGQVNAPYPPYGNAVMYSTDTGATWTQATTPLDAGQINGVCWSEALGLFIAVGYLAPSRQGWTIGDVNWSGSGWAVGTTP